MLMRSLAKRAMSFGKDTQQNARKMAPKKISSEHICLFSLVGAQGIVHHKLIQRFRLQPQGRGQR